MRVSIVQVLLFASLIFGPSAIAQSVEQWIAWGDASFAKEEYYGASRFYNGALALEPGRMSLQWKQAEALRLSNQYPQAITSIRTATHLLTGVHKITKERQSNRRGPKRQEDWILPVILAVAVYMTEQPGLTFERSWPGWASELSHISEPPTRTVQLIEAVLDAYGIEYDYPRIRTRLIECAQRLAGDTATESHLGP